jgi:hypothetical protein
MRCPRRENSTGQNYWNLQRKNKFGDVCQFFVKFINLFEQSREVFWPVFQRKYRCSLRENFTELNYWNLQNLQIYVNFRQI